MQSDKSPRQPKKPFQNLAKKERTERPVRKSTGRSENRIEKPFKSRPKEDRPAKPSFKREKPFSASEEREKPIKRAFKKERPNPAGEESERPAKRAFKKERPYPAREGGDKPAKRAFKTERPYKSREEGENRPKRYEKREKPYSERDERQRPVKRVIEKKSQGDSTEPARKYALRSGMRIKPVKGEREGIRLNKYIANSGICSRRDADTLIKAGVIKVNGKVVTALGSKVLSDDKVQYGDQTLANERKRYLLLNKQKGYVTTTSDPHAKNTVMELIAGACKERIYPVGRLDRNTTGLLLFTNDGEMAKKLMHPKSRIKKLYHVVLDQPLSKANMIKIADGIELEGERVEVDSIEYVEDAADRREIGMEIHTGQNRVIRRIFEQLGHKVVKLDRVLYANLTKKNLPRGTWRFLTEKEIISLIMMR